MILTYLFENPTTGAETLTAYLHPCFHRSVYQYRTTRPIGGIRTEIPASKAKTRESESSQTHNAANKDIAQNKESTNGKISLKTNAATEASTSTTNTAT